MSGLTEAYYLKLPIIALTATQNIAKIGHLIPQVIDRSSPPADVTKYSALLPEIKNKDDLWDCEIKVNTALLECRRRGGGPVHLNVETTYSKIFDIKELPKYRKIDRITFSDHFPTLPKGKIAIYIGAHADMAEEQISAIDKFCASNNALVFRDITSSYNGEYAVQFALVMAQTNLDRTPFFPDLLIHIGEVSGDYYSLSIKAKNVWRVNPDGEIRDNFRALNKIFEMPIEYFFDRYTTDVNQENSYLDACKKALKSVKAKFPKIPYSNIWIASQLAHKIPELSTIHYGRSHTFRSWNLFELPKSVKSMANVGGCGIDGSISTLIGASFCYPQKLFFLILGDLTFFYDMNVIGNRHVGNNVRILLVNNGKGTEFRNYNHFAARFADEADLYIAAGGHYGNKSSELVKNFAENLGYEYITASEKEEFLAIYEKFTNPTITDKPMIFEVFTKSENESNALKAVASIETDIKGNAKIIAKSMLGDKGIKKLKNFLNK